MALIWMMIGALIGVFVMALMQINKYEDVKIETVYPADCQIHRDYNCMNQCDCKGNPELCKSAAKK